VAELTGTGEPGSSLTELVEVIGRLRRECAWKAGQTHESLTRYLLEESHELVEAIESGDPDRVRDELGDVLLQVYLHAAIAAESGAFDIEDVAAGLHEKMIRRNPHVFGDPADRETDPERINARWQEIKASEPGRADRAGDAMAGVPEGLPALLRADKLLDRLARADRDPEVDPASTDVGERLLALVAEARAAGVDPEQALRGAVRRRQR
jgi:XTP/dITP diphosphohydrolase